MRRRCHRGITWFGPSWIVVAVLGLAAQRAEAGAPACTGNALVTLDGGAIVNVDWPERSDTELKGHAIVNQTLRVDYQVDLRRDGSVSAAQVTTSTLAKPNPAKSYPVAAGSPTRCSRRSRDG